MGNINESPIEEIWNSGKMKDLRQQLLDGKKPAICKRCYDKERSGSISHRQYSNKKFSHLLEDAQTSEAKLNLKHWDFRFSNLCNLKCRTCGPEFSSSWVPDIEKLSITPNKKFNKVTKNKNKNIYDLIDNNISNVERIYFAGGEPLLMDEHWYILQKLDDLGRYDVVLEYNTNLTTLVRGNKNVLYYWDKFKVDVWPSIDEIGKRAEIIRSGTVWSKVENNLKEIIEAGINPQPSITISVMNVHRIKEIVDHLISLGIKPAHIGFNMVNTPLHYNIAIMNDKAKVKILRHITDFILDYKLKYGVDYTQKLNQIRNQLKTPQIVQGAHQFEMYTRLLDSVRKESLFDIIPEIKDHVQVL